MIPQQHSPGIDRVLLKATWATPRRCHLPGRHLWGTPRTCFSIRLVCRCFVGSRTSRDWTRPSSAGPHTQEEEGARTARSTSSPAKATASAGLRGTRPASPQQRVRLRSAAGARSSGAAAGRGSSRKRRPPVRVRPAAPGPGSRPAARGGAGRPRRRAGIPSGNDVPAAGGDWPRRGEFSIYGHGAAAALRRRPPRPFPARASPGARGPPRHTPPARGRRAGAASRRPAPAAGCARGEGGLAPSLSPGAPACLGRAAGSGARSSSDGRRGARGRGGGSPPGGGPRRLSVVFPCALPGRDCG